VAPEEVELPVTDSQIPTVEPDRAWTDDVPRPQPARRTPGQAQLAAALAASEAERGRVAFDDLASLGEHLRRTPPAERTIGVKH
jgi:hypothetical protein